MIEGQLSLFDLMPEIQPPRPPEPPRPIMKATDYGPEPEVGEYVRKHGANICRIMRPGYLGKKVVIDKSTASRKWFQVGILERIVPAAYYKQDEHGEYVRVECDRSVVYTGTKQRSLITHMPGIEIYECLPWDAYQARLDAIGVRGG